MVTITIGGYIRFLNSPRIKKKMQARPSTRVACLAGLSTGVGRRNVLEAGVLLLAPFLTTSVSNADESSTTTALCDSGCLKDLNQASIEATPSGLQYQDIVVGRGPTAPTGYQAVAHVVTMNQQGTVVDSTFDRSLPFDIRVGAGQVVPGLDEGIKTMGVGGVRRLYVPGSLAFKQNLRAAPGRPRIEANTPLVIDVQLLYVPGLDFGEE